MNKNEIKIPSGVVTFLFTDIEGSTKLSQQFPEKLPAALEIQQLSEEEFNKYWEEGKKLTLDEAVALALRKDDNA